MRGRVIGGARGIGFLLGLSVAVVAVLSWRIPAGSGTLGTDIAIAARPTGELTVSTTAPFIVASGIRPGSTAATGSVEVRNHSAAVLEITIVAEPSLTDLDDLLWLEVDERGHDVFRGAIGELRQGSDGTFTLRPGQTITLGVRGWLPTSVDAGYEGRIVDVALAFEAEVVGRP